MRKKAAVTIIVILFIISLFSCGTNPPKNRDTDPYGNTDYVSTQAETAEITEKDYFSDGDLRDVTDETPNAVITLSGNKGEISDNARGSSGETVTVTSKGIYRVNGSSEGVSIVIDDSKKSGVVYLVFCGTTMINSSYPCIVVENADKVVILSDGVSSLTYNAEKSDYDGAVYSSDDVTFGGRGTLSITSSLHGVVGKDDVKVTGGTLSIKADGIGIKANDSLRIGGGTVDIESGHDGVQISDDKKDGLFVIQNGSAAIKSGYDGIDVKSASSDKKASVVISGEVYIQTGGFPDNKPDSEKSQKGIKCEGSISMNNGNVTVLSYEDCLHSDGNVTFSGGSLYIRTNDDGIHSGGDLVISGGLVTVDESYEGIEANNVNITGGEIKVQSSDDGINSADGSVEIADGKVYVNAGGDGIDANGSIYVSGGEVIIEGPTNNGNGILDIGKNGCIAEITGGTVLAIGSSGMAINFDSGTQCSALLALSGKEGDKITVDDGSGFSFTATKQFACVLYSSPNLTEGNAYVIKAGKETATADFGKVMFYTDLNK